RVSISTSYWPLAWLPPRPVRLTLHTGASSLKLPVRPARESDQSLRTFAGPVGAPGPEIRQLQPKTHKWRVIRDLGAEESSLEVVLDEGTFCFQDIEWIVSSKGQEWYTFRYDDFDSARGETVWYRRFQREKWCVQTRTRTVLTSTATHFRLHAELDAYQGEERIFSRNWLCEIPRDHL
ncbi:MAG: peptidase S15, partial [Desulfohalobiaceae bacterium]